MTEEEKTAEWRRMCLVLFGSMLSAQITTLLLLSESITDPKLKEAVGETLTKLQKQTDNLYQGMHAKPPDQHFQ